MLSDTLKQIESLPSVQEIYHRLSEIARERSLLKKMLELAKQAAEERKACEPPASPPV